MVMTPAMLATMRAQSRQMLPDTCTRERDTETSDGEGGHTVTTDSSQTYPCLVTMPQQRPWEGVQTGALTSVASIRIDLPYDADVTVKDRLAVTGGNTYEVTAVHLTSFAVYLQAECLLVV